MPRAIFRLGRKFTVVGVAGILFATYLALYSTGVVKWRAFPKADDFGSDPMATWGYFAFLWLGGTVLLWGAYRIRVSLTDTEVEYRGAFTTTRIGWGEMQGIKVRANQGDIDIWSTHRHIQIRPRWFADAAALKQQIIEHARQHCPQTPIYE